MTESRRLRRLIFEWHSFLAALGLMSRVPVAWLSNYALKSEHHHRAQIWYPAVGLLLGGVLALTAVLLPEYSNSFLRGVIVVTLWIAFTGALHIDGLADTADAWVGGMSDRQRTLDIMKDPASGPSGVTAIVLSLLLKCGLLISLLDSALWPTLILIPMLARSWLLPILASLPYARASSGAEQDLSTKAGMASTIARSFPKSAGTASFIASQLLALALCVWLPNGLFILLTANLVSAAVFFAIRASTNRRLGGYTGDLLGASIELQELGLLASIALFISA